MKYFEAFSGSGYHSAFLTTYALSAQAFEDIPFPRLRGAGCRNITILADRGMTNASFSDFGPPRFAGTLYHVVKTSMPGAFHPKITLLVGEKKGRLLVGSANLTALGLGGNRELVADISFTDELPELVSSFGQALAYIQRHVPEGDPWFDTALKRALRHAPWLQNAIAETEDAGEGQPLFLCDQPEQTILDQIIAAVGDDPIHKLTILSPFWDERLEGLKQLRDAIGTPPTNILLQPARGLFPVESLERFQDTQIFDVDASDSTRFSHAKLFIAHGAVWDHVISGSMNCSLPALLGQTTPSGNAEAGIYKRVPRDTALVELKLEKHEDAPISLADLPRREEREAHKTETEAVFDPGNFELREGRLFWDARTNGDSVPIEVQLFDRGEEHLLDVLKVDKTQSSQRWIIDLGRGRPRVARVVGEGGHLSAPTSVVDLAILSSSTLPAMRGRKRTIVDGLAELDHEDLMILEALNELETLDLPAQSETGAINSRPQNASTASEQQIVHQTLPYEAFVAARNRPQSDGATPLFLRTHGETPASLINGCLNRLVGLVSEDLSKGEEHALDQEGATDFRTTEPADGPEDDETTNDTIEREAKSARRARVASTSKKYIQAVSAFEQRTRSLSDAHITTAELVRLRVLLQVVLAGAMPIDGAPKPHQILPVSGKDGNDWPRLLGRLLQQHFGTIHALRKLQVEADESEHSRVLDYLATARFASRAALEAALSDTGPMALRKPLAMLAKDLESQIEGVIGSNQDDQNYLEALHKKLEDRFASALGLAGS